MFNLKKFLIIPIFFSCLLTSCDLQEDPKKANYPFKEVKDLPNIEYLEKVAKGEIKDKEYPEDEAILLVAKMYYRGYKVTQNVPEAIKWLKRALENESECAALILGNMYYEGIYLPKNIKKAIELWTSTSSDCSTDGYHCDYDAYQAYRNFAALAEENPKKYAYELGLFCFEKGCIPHNPEPENSRTSLMIMPCHGRTASKWLKKAFKAGKTEASYNLAELYADNPSYSLTEDTEDNPLEKAVYWYTIASDLRIASAHFPLGLRYYVDDVDVICWYRFYLGGAKPDIHMALKYFKRAAAEGDPMGIYMLAKIYERGEKITKNDKKYKFWYNKLSEADKKKIAESYLPHLLNRYWERSLEIFIGDKEENERIEIMRNRFLTNFKDLMPYIEKEF